MQVPGDLYGLIICGGNSTRMGSDKGSLVYYKKPQRYHLHDMLNPLCSKVFLSCNKNQAGFNSNEYQVLTDLQQFENIGPMAALLTAFRHFPDHDYLVAGCDYPFLKQKDLEIFLEKIEKKSIAAAFFNKYQKYEPMLAWYSREAAPLLFKSFENNQYSLQKFLKENKAEKFQPENEIIMHSADTPEDYLNAKKIIDAAI